MMTTTPYFQVASTPSFLCFNIVMGQCQEIFYFSFFNESATPGLLIISLSPFQIFTEIPGDIHISRLITNVNDINSMLEKVYYFSISCLDSMSSLKNWFYQKYNVW
jgi:hypothetical protein